MTTAIWWVRRDLRLNDNDALRAALAHGGRVVPVFVLDPTLLAAPDISAKRLAFLFGGLRALDADLRARGSRLIVRRGDPAAELARLVAETGAEALYAEADPWPYGRQRDAAIAAQLPLRLLSGLTAQPFDLIRKGRRYALHGLHPVQPGVEGAAAADAGTALGAARKAAGRTRRPAEPADPR